ncbi:MORC family CW-type zinc finger protein 3-like isoform X2 [Tachysurus ichikawai]
MLGLPIGLEFKTTELESTAPKHAESLRDILAHSLFNTEEELFSQFKVIESLAKLSGTCIIIWNLRRKSSGEFEFDFLKDPKDIRILDDVYKKFRKSNKRQAQESMSVPESVYSLRAYCSILYLIPKMEIILQGQKVEAQSITTTLARPCTDTYKPECLKKAIKITIGYNKKSMENYGLMMYNKNRLIKSYVHVACQRRGNHTGQGVIGVIECNHLVPTHNKQDFDDTQEYRNTMKNLNIKLEQYWKIFTYNHQEFKPVDNTESCTDAAQATCPRLLPEVSDEGQLGSLKTHKGRKKRTLDQCQDITEKKKSKQIDLDNNIPGTSTSTASPAMFSQARSEKIVGIKNIKTQASSEHQQNFEDQLLKAKQEINQLQFKVNSLEVEKSTLASCCESLKKGRTNSGELELDFMKDPYDIRIPIDVYENTKEPKNQQNQTCMSVPESEYSLRAYISILYLKPRMQIIIQGQKVETQFVTKSLAKVSKNTYKPRNHKEKITITFGYNTKTKEHYGIMMYNKNRLIKAYEHVACQRRAYSTGVGIIGVIECNHLKPTHNKQDFDNTDEYRVSLLFSLRLRELRESVGRLLATLVPALDLQHVNHDSEDIDEMLNEVINQISMTEAAST